MKKSPFLILTISLAILFTLLGFAVGKKNGFGDGGVLSEPLLSHAFNGFREGIYPWNLFTKDDTKAGDLSASANEEALPSEVPSPSPEPVSTPTPAPTAAKESPSPSISPTPSPTPEFPEGRLEPLRESTHEEYLAHISADIYGDMGVKRAASYEFCEVTEDYFDDALFIGDSRTVGLGKYTDLPEHATFLCVTSLTAEKVFSSNFKGKGTLESYLTSNRYGKIYLMVGINELGSGTTEYFMQKYTEVVDRIMELQPDAIIFVEAVMKVDKEKNDSDRIFNNTNITGRNHAIATLADNRRVFYIDVNEVVCDEDGNLKADLTFDHLHLIGSSYELWKDFLLKHGVPTEE